MELTSAGRLIHYSNVGIFTYDLNDDDGAWRHFFGYERYAGIPGQGVGSVAVDPLDPDVTYFCTGQLTTWSSSSVDYHTGFFLGSISRSLDGLESSEIIAGDDSLEDTYTFGCSTFGYARYIIDTAADGTEIEGWKLLAKSDLFAFDTRESVTIADKTVSKVIFHLSYMRGLLRGEYQSDGTLTWQTVALAPKFYDELDYSSSWNTSAGTSEDWIYYQYEPQDGATASDERSTYAGSGFTGMKCDYEYSPGLEVLGDYSLLDGHCVEDEYHYIGTDVEIDPVALASGDLILVTGGMHNQLWNDGGLYYIVENSDGTYAETEITHPDTGGHLDVRDVIFDETVSVTLDSGKTVAKYFYVAAGRHGVFKVEVQTDGSFSITDINNGFYPRERYLAEYPSHDTEFCSGEDISCGQAWGIDHAYVDGQAHLLLSHSGGVMYAIDDFANPIQWYEIAGFNSGVYTSTRDGALSESQETAWANDTNWGGMTEKAIIVPDERVFIVGRDYIYKVDIDSLAVVSDSGDRKWVRADWHSFSEGFGDRGAASTIAFDPIDPDHRVHFSVLDYAYDTFSWDDDLALDEAEFDNTLETGFCYGAYFVPSGSDLSEIEAHLSSTDSEMIDATYLSSLTSMRFNYYGHRILTANASTDAKNAVIYVGTSHNSTSYDGALMKATWDDGSSQWKWAMAAGDGECTMKYPSWNGNKNMCYFICEEGDNPLPQGGQYYFTVYPRDPNVLFMLTALMSDSTVHFYQSTDGGANWTENASAYVDEDTGTSLATLGTPSALVHDPLDKRVFYVAYGKSGIYKLNPTTGKFKNITNATAYSMAPTSTLSYVSSGSTQTPYVRALKAVDDGGVTRLYIGADPWCKGGYGKYPVMPCTTIDGGGIYTILPESESSWTKLNMSSTDYKYFLVNDIAISLANPNHIVAVGSGENFDWGGGGHLANATTGILYSTDKGATWDKVTTKIVGSRFVSAHPTDPDIFVLSMDAAGLWRLDLGTQ